MKIIDELKSYVKWFVILTSICLTACNNSFISSDVKGIYLSPKISSYKIEAIALLPILPDDSTDYGAYYSTNHFFNILERKYPSLIIADIDWVRNFDCSFIDKQTNFIKIKKRLDLQSFYDTDLGYNIIEENYDAVLLGMIDSTYNSYGIYLGISEDYFPVRGWMTSCKFTYYLVSLIDGRILWRATVSGEDACKMENYFIKEFPPVDYAISNGIDRMVDYLPTEIFK